MSGYRPDDMVGIKMSLEHWRWVVKALDKVAVEELSDLDYVRAALKLAVGDCPPHVESMIVYPSALNYPPEERGKP